MAIAEAKKLFSKTGGQTADGGNQQDVLNSAASTLMKLMVQSKMSGLMGSGGGAAGGAASSGGGNMLSSASLSLPLSRFPGVFCCPVCLEADFEPFPFAKASPASFSSRSIFHLAMHARNNGETS